MERKHQFYLIAFILSQICLLFATVMMFSRDTLYTGNRESRWSERYVENENSQTDKRTSDVRHFYENHIFQCHGPTGRLGNAIFDFASSLGFARSLNYKYVMKPNHTVHKYFETNQTVTNDVENLLSIPVLSWKNDKWRNTTDYLSYNLTLTGCWRMWRFFKDVSEEVRKSLTIKPQFLNQAKEFLSNNTPAVKTLVGIHVRRGDFLSERSINKGRVVASKEYIKLAMNIFRKQYSDTVFVVVSNDKKWCQENIKGKNVIFSAFEEAILDLAILSLCDHVVMTVGTFGWWGGWLAGGTVVYCKDYPKPGSYLDNNILFRDELYPPEWIGLENCSE